MMTQDEVVLCWVLETIVCPRVQQDYGQRITYPLTQGKSGYFILKLLLYGVSYPQNQDCLNTRKVIYKNRINFMHLYAVVSNS